MTQKSDKPASKSAATAKTATTKGEPAERDWSGAAAIAGAAIGSAALAAALLYVSRRKDNAKSPTAAPAHPQQAPETD